MKKEQESMEKLLKSELKKEAEEILADVEAEESLKDVFLPEEMDDELEAMILKIEAERAARKMLSPKDKEALQIGIETQMLRGGDEDEDEKETKETAGKDDSVKNGDETDKVGKAESVQTSGGRIIRYRKKMRKGYLLVAVAAVLVLAIGMTSIGGAPLIPSVLKEIIGDREMVQIETEKEGENGRVISGNDEEKFYQEMESEFAFKPVKLGYIPEGTEFLEYDIDKDLPRGCLLFMYNDDIIEYRIVINYRDFSYGYDIEDKLIKESIVDVSGVSINIKQYATPENGDEFVAQFKYNNAVYTLNAAIQEEEFYKIIKNLIFS